MACSKYNIKVVEHNDFTLLFPLKKRTYVASLPIDEDIVIEDLENLKVTIGGVEFSSTLDERGVMVAVAYDALERGTYDIIITAEYHGAQIRAAYFEGLTIVNWNMQSDAEQFLPGSPIVMQAAFVIGGPLTDAELEELKQQYREAKAAAEQAQAEAQAAKEHYDQLAEQLQGVAQEQTLTQGVQDIRDDISHIDIDTTTLAKQGSDPNATNTAILSAVQDSTTEIQTIVPDGLAGKTALVQAVNAKGASLTINSPLADIATIVSSMALIASGDIEFAEGVDATSVSKMIALFRNYCVKYKNVLTAQFTNAIDIDMYKSLPLLQSVEFQELLSISTTVEVQNNLLYNCASLVSAKFPNLLEVSLNNTGNCQIYMLASCPNLIDISFPALASLKMESRSQNMQMRFMEYCTSIENVEFPSLSIITVDSSSASSDHNYMLQGCTSLKSAKFATEVDEINAQYGEADRFYAFNNCPLLKDITLGKSENGVGSINANVLLFIGWYPTTIVADTTSRAEMNANIRNHIVANLRDRTGLSSLTFYFNTNMQSYFEQATLDAFAAKNWTLAYRTY